MRAVRSRACASARLHGILLRSNACAQTHVQWSYLTIATACRLFRTIQEIKIVTRLLLLLYMCAGIAVVAYISTRLNALALAPWSRRWSFIWKRGGRRESEEFDFDLFLFLSMLFHSTRKWNAIKRVRHMRKYASLCLCEIT